MRVVDLRESEVGDDPVQREHVVFAEPERDDGERQPVDGDDSQDPPGGEREDGRGRRSVVARLHERPVQQERGQEQEDRDPGIQPRQQRADVPDRYEVEDDMRAEHAQDRHSPQGVEQRVSGSG